MLKVTSGNKKRALQILTTAFKDTPGVLWVIKKDKHLLARISVLCDFCLSVSMQKDGAFITSDDKGVVLIFQSTVKQEPIQWFLAYFKLGAKCIGWSRAWSVIQREKHIISRRPKTKHLYLWMMGIEDNEHGLKTIIEIRDFIFNYAKKLQLPIFAETTVERNLTLFKRYGFKVYDEWEVPEKGIKVWFIKRDWNPNTTLLL